MRYLWIDRLCMIQGEKSVKDWSLYVKIHLKIAASCAAASVEGTYAFRDTKSLRPAVIVGSDRFGLTHDLYLLVWGSLLPCYSTLSRRGCLLQEQLLSRRIFHVEADQIH
jgi:hypothetical protein